MYVHPLIFCIFL